MLEEVLRKGMVEMKDGMKGLLWKIERSRDISQEGIKCIVMKGFEAMSVVIEGAVRKIGERLVEEGRRRDRGERELVERLRLLEEETFSRERARMSAERTREERMQELEKRLKDVGIEVGKKEERIQVWRRWQQKERKETGLQTRPWQS